MYVRKEVLELVNLFQQTWPNLFKLKKPCPLAIGIYDQLVAEFSNFEPRFVKRAIGRWCGLDVYLMQLKAGSPRLNLDGSVAGVVTVEEADFAKQQKTEAQKNREKKRLIKQQNIAKNALDLEAAKVKKLEAPKVKEVKTNIPFVKSRSLRPAAKPDMVKVEVPIPKPVVIIPEEVKAPVQFFDGKSLKLPHWSEPRKLTPTQIECVKILWGKESESPPIVTYASVKEVLKTSYSSFKAMFKAEDVVTEVSDKKFQLRRIKK